MRVPFATKTAAAADDGALHVEGGDEVGGDGGVAAATNALVDVATNAFFHNDLLRAGLELMRGAEGSFGLVLSHSLDATSDLVVAARGQTMSVAGPHPQRPDPAACSQC